MFRVGKKAGRELDGRTWEEFPEVRSSDLELGALAKAHKDPAD